LIVTRLLVGFVEIEDARKRFQGPMAGMVIPKP
jgi:hypothetical protein